MKENGEVRYIEVDLFSRKRCSQLTAKVEFLISSFKINEALFTFFLNFDYFIQFVPTDRHGSSNIFFFISMIEENVLYLIVNHISRYYMMGLHIVAPLQVKQKVMIVVYP